MSASRDESILIVDDVPENLDLLVGILKDRYRVRPVSSGEHALRAAAADPPDLVLLDLCMPGLDGYAVCRLLKQQPSLASIPVIVISARDKPLDKVKAFGLGAVDYLTKPIQIDEVRARVQTHLRISRLRSQLAERNQELEATVQVLQQREAALQASRERYELAVKGSNDALWDWDIRNETTYVSPRWRDMLGIDDDDDAELGIPALWEERVHSDDAQHLRDDLEAHLAGQTDHFANEHRIRHADGGLRYMVVRGMALRDEVGVPHRMAGSISDVTRARVYDPVTGLPNQLDLRERIDWALAHRTSSGGKMGLLVLGVDRYDLLDQSLEHHAADQLLAGLAARLLECAPRGATLFRLAGAEFGLWLPSLSAPDEALRLARHIQERTGQSFCAETREVFLTLGIGAAILDSYHANADAILQEASTAMQRARAEGAARVVLFDEQMQRQAVARLQMETDLRRAVERSEFCLHYQPIVTLADRRIAAVEALIRWNHPERGLIPPGAFIPIAEDSELIIPIGWWVLQESCRQLLAWRRQGLAKGLSVSVNVSALQLTHPRVLQIISQTVGEVGVDPADIKLEVTESTLVAEPDHAARVLTALQQAGFRICLDDFGTGYSSLSYLQRFPIDVLKIDRSFVRHVDVDGKRTALVRHIAALAHDLDMDVLAEGVETETQREVLVSLECQQAQGYLFAKPHAPEQVVELLGRGALAA